MESFAYACYQDSLLLADINDQWRPYIPSWYPMKASSSPNSTAGGPSSTATIITGAPTTSLSEGAIAGIAVGGLAAVILMAICGFCFWRSNKKLKRKSREVAHMADALQQGGVAQRIDELGRPGYESPVEMAAVRSDSFSNYSPMKNEELTPEPLRVRKRSGEERKPEYTTPIYTTPIARETYDPNAFYKTQPQSSSPSNYDYGLGRRPSDFRGSTDSFGTTAVTSNMGTTAVTSAAPKRYLRDDPTMRHQFSYSPVAMSRHLSTNSRTSIFSAPVEYDQFGRKITPPTITYG
jgi:hypothetical protein